MPPHTHADPRKKARLGGEGHWVWRRITRGGHTFWIRSRKPIPLEYSYTTRDGFIVHVKKEPISKSYNGEGLKVAATVNSRKIPQGSEKQRRWMKHLRSGEAKIWNRAEKVALGRRRIDNLKKRQNFYDRQLARIEAAKKAKAEKQIGRGLNKLSKIIKKGVKGGFKKIKNYNKKMNPLSWITKPSEGEEKMAQLFKRMEEEKNWVKHDEKPAKKSALSWISKPSEGEEKMAQLFNRMEEEKRKNRKK